MSASSSHTTVLASTTTNPSPILPMPPPTRLTAAPGPWLHGGFQAGNLDVDAVAHDLAVKVDPSASQHSKIIPVFRKFFTNMVDFDKKACQNAYTELHSLLNVDSAFHYLGIQTMEQGKAIQKSQKIQEWISSKITPLVVADRLASLAQPTNLAPLVSARAPPSGLAEVKNMALQLADWHNTMSSARKLWGQRGAAAFDLPSAARDPKKRSQFFRLVDLTTRPSSSVTPYLTPGTITDLVRLEANAEWSEDDVQTAVTETKFRDMWKTVLVARTFHTAATPTPDFPSHPVSIIDECCWLNVLRAALGLIETAEVFPLLFGHPEVVAILSQPVDPTHRHALAIPFDPVPNPPSEPPPQLPAPLKNVEPMALDELDTLIPLEDHFGFAIYSALEPMEVDPSTRQFHSERSSTNSPTFPLTQVQQRARTVSSTTALETPSPNHRSARRPPLGRPPAPPKTAGPTASKDDIDDRVPAERGLERPLHLRATAGKTPAPPKTVGPTAGNDEPVVDDILPRFPPPSATAQEALVALLVPPRPASPPASASTASSDMDISDGESFGPAGASPGPADSELSEAESSNPKPVASGKRARSPTPNEDEAGSEDDGRLEGEDSPEEEGERLVKKQRRNENEDTSEGEKSLEEEDSLEEEVQRPAKKRRRNPAQTESNRTLRSAVKKPASNANTAPFKITMPSSARRPAASAKPKVAPAQKRAHQHQSVPWLAVSKDFKIEKQRECEILLEKYQDLKNHLDPDKLYPLASDEDEVDIEYHVWEETPEGSLRTTRRMYRWRPFAATRSDAKVIRKVVASQRHRSYDGESVPLHVHPDAQVLPTTAFPTGPSDQRSVVHVATESRWDSLAPSQQMEVLRDHVVLTVAKEPTHPGLTEFSVESMSAFTNTSRLAFIHDVGGRKPGAPPANRPAFPSDLIRCMEAQAQWQVDHQNDPPGQKQMVQRLNLLSNRLPGMTLPSPRAWRNLATHEFAAMFLRGLHQIPELRFLWEEFVWSIFCLGGTPTISRLDTEQTLIEICCGEKLWFVGRRRTDLAPHDDRGDMHSRHAFAGFDGWKANTDVWEFEMVHLTPQTRLYMPAGFIHLVISPTACIAAGRHGIPASNLTRCVLVTLHNVMLSAVTTNADHEPARRFLLRIFVFIALAFIDKENADLLDPKRQPTTKTSKGKGKAPQAAAEKEEERLIKDHYEREACRRHSKLPDRVLQHLPDLADKAGIVDLLGLRAFVVLYLALYSSLYEYKVKDEASDQQALPIDTGLWTELQYAWEVAVWLDRWIEKQYEFRLEREAGDDERWPESWQEAADMVLLAMCASTIRYHGDTEKEFGCFRPKGFDTDAFEVQVFQMLGRFDLRRQWMNYELMKKEKPAFGKDDRIDASEFGKFELVKGLDELCGRDDTDHSALLLWDSRSLPFRLVPK
ncbi:hypothetical protein MVEN_01642400 [Mycena venus]|uniref:JmjC domain-containing protein n=1 Tax=Mycena venus TaxID=2733690 RepID=A0A8H6XNZ0_9AGAR|nr:hypothetical protein MVEN_01642400 [Mycena venus]